jgi:hypothetical protein
VSDKFRYKTVVNHMVKPAPTRRGGLIRLSGLLIAVLGLAFGAQAAPPSGHSPRAVPEEIILRGTDSEGNELALRVPVNILMAHLGGLAQLQQPGSGANINLNQIGGSSVSSALYDSGNNALKVNCIVGCSATGSFTDNSAFTTGSTSVTNVSGLFNDTATNLTSGNAGAIRATTDRMLFVNVGKINGTVPTLTGSSLNVNCTGGCSSSAGFTDNSAFTAGTTTETNVGGVFNDGLSALTSGNAAAARITPNRGVHANLRNNSGTEIATSANPLRIDPTGTTTQPVNGTVTSNIGTTNGLALDTSVNGLLLGQGSTTSGQKGPLAQCAVTTSAPSYTTSQTDPLSCNTAGGLRVDGSGVTQPVSGTVTANAGTGQFNVTCTAANCPMNVAQFGGTNVVTGTGASGAGIPRVTVSNDSNVLATQSGTWTVQPGNTQNTTPWLVQGNLSNNGAAAGTNRIGTLDGIAQTDFNNGAAATQGRDVAPNVGTDGLLWTAQLPAMRPASYHASAIVAPAATATDIATMPGNATNTVLVTGIRVSCTQTTGSIINLSILMRTTADSAGTAVTTTIHKDDSNYAAASSAPKTWTANPTKGTLEAMVDSVKLGCMAPGMLSPNDIYISPANWRMKPMVLRGTAQELEVNLGTPIDGTGTTVTGGSFLITFEWIETKTITP